MVTDSIVAETATRVFRDHCDLQAIIAARNDDWKSGAWSQIEDAGLSLAWVPDNLGGAGAEVADGFAVLRETGRFAVALPVAETLLAGWLLSRAGISAPPGAMACGPAREGDALTVAKDGRLSGRLRGIAFAKGAGHLAVLAGREGGGTAVALLGADGLRIGDGTGPAGDPLNSIVLDRARPLALKDADLGADALLLMGAAVRAMQMAGALEAILDIGVRYANERVAFGKPIAKFQAVQHNLARLAGETAAALAAAGSAADAIAAVAPSSPPPSWGRDREGGIAGQPSSGFPPPLAPPHKGEGNPSANSDALFLEVAAAKIRVGEAAGEGAAIAHQVLGAIGFTREHILHRYTQRLWAWRDDFGSESQWAVKLGHRVAVNGADALWPMLAAR
jgi:acyl-CoA dehydrogenase